MVEGHKTPHGGKGFAVNARALLGVNPFTLKVERYEEALAYLGLFLIGDLDLVALRTMKHWQIWILQVLSCSDYMAAATAVPSRSNCRRSH